MEIQIIAACHLQNSRMRYLKITVSRFQKKRIFQLQRNFPDVDITQTTNSLNICDPKLCFVKWWTEICIQFRILRWRNDRRQQQIRIRYMELDICLLEWANELWGGLEVSVSSFINYGLDAFVLSILHRNLHTMRDGRTLLSNSTSS